MADSDQCDTTMHARNQEDINYILEDRYEDDNNKQSETKNKPGNRADTFQKLYKE